jgi:hypothetical protein
MTLSRRRFLRAAGVSLARPWQEFVARGQGKYAEQFRLS